MTEGADPSFVWTDEDKERVARSALATEAVRRGHLSGEEALTMVLSGKPDTPEYMEAVAAKIEEIPWPGPAYSRRDRGPANHREREVERYHSDPAYRERKLARQRASRKTPEFRAKERERAARRRAARRAS